MKVVPSLSKSIVLHGFYAIKGFDLLRFLRRRFISIVFYHRFSDRDEPFKLRVDRFERQIRFFKKKYNLVSLNQYVKALDGKCGLPDNPLIVTIDDGYWDNYHIAFPILRNHNVPATIFLATDFVDKRAWLWSNKLEYILKNSKYERFSYQLNGKVLDLKVDSFEQWHASQLAIFNALRQRADQEKDKILADLAKHLRVTVPDGTQGDFLPLSWEEVKTMHNSGIEFGSHSSSHAILSRVAPPDLPRELLGSKEKIEKAIQEPVISFCYPNGQPGDYSNFVKQELSKAGYQCAVTTIHGLNPPPPRSRPFELKRFSVSAEYTLRLTRQLI